MPNLVKQKKQKRKKKNKKEKWVTVKTVRRRFTSSRTVNNEVDSPQESGALPMVQPLTDF